MLRNQNPQKRIKNWEKPGIRITKKFAPNVTKVLALGGIKNVKKFCAGSVTKLFIRKCFQTVLKF